MSFMKKLLSNKKVWATLVVVIIILVVIWARAGGKKPVSDLFTVKKDTITQEVSVTGTVKPAEDIKLAFEVSGRVGSLGANVGDRVSAGQILVGLEHSDLSAQLASARAAVESARAQQAQYQAAYESQVAKLAALQRGSRPEDIAVKQEDLKAAQQDLNNYYDDVVDTLSDAYTKSDDALRNKLASLFSGSVTTSYSLTFVTSDYQAGIDAANQRSDVDRELAVWRRQLDSVTSQSSQVSMDEALQSGKNHLLSLKKFLERTNDTLQTSTNLTATNLDTYRASVNTARTNVVTALGTVSALEQNIAAQKVSVQQTQKELDLKLSGSDPQDIASGEAVVRQAAASVQSAQATVRQNEANAGSVMAKISKMTLISPIDGVVTKQDAKVGQIVAPNVEIVGVISDSNYEIKADVPEVDISKVRLGNEADVTLDAYGNDSMFVAKVVKIEPAETVISGVIYYKVTLIFDKPDERLKSGMTANVVIKTARKEGVLAIPQRAIVEEGGKKYVRVVEKNDGQNYVKKEVAVGLSGTSGMVEVLSGLSEGETIITFLK